jgi:hypothetical protein
MLDLDMSNSACREFQFDKGTHTIQKNCVGDRVLGNIKTKIRFNDKGLPSPNVKNKTPGVLRICFLGGSNMVGLGIQEEYYPQKILQEEFEKALGRKVELINISVEGYTTAQHALMFVEFFDALKPDVVISYTSSGYKIFRDAVQFSYTVRQPNGNSIRFLKVKEIIPEWIFFLISYSETLKKMARTIIENVRFLSLERKLNELKDNENKQAEILFSPTIEYFKFMDKFSWNNDADFYVVVDDMDIENLYARKFYEEGPFHALFNLFQDKIIIRSRKLKQVLAINKISMLDSDAIFSKEDYFENSIYFNKEGINKFAKNLAENFAEAIIYQ